VKTPIVNYAEARGNSPYWAREVRAWHAQQRTSESGSPSIDTTFCTTSVVKHNTRTPSDEKLVKSRIMNRAREHRNSPYWARAMTVSCAECRTSRSGSTSIDTTFCIISVVKVAVWASSGGISDHEPRRRTNKLTVLDECGQSLKGQMAHIPH
jgi:hypothetical protein